MHKQCQQSATRAVPTWGGREAWGICRTSLGGRGTYAPPARRNTAPILQEARVSVTSMTNYSYTDVLTHCVGYNKRAAECSRVSEMVVYLEGLIRHLKIPSTVDNTSGSVHPDL